MKPDGAGVERGGGGAKERADRSGLFAWLGSFSYRHRKLLAGVLLLLTVVASVLGTRVFEHLEGGGFRVEDDAASRTEAILYEQFGRLPPDVVVAYSHPDWKASGPEFQAELEEIARELREREGVGEVRYPERGTAAAAPLQSQDEEIALMVVGLHGESDREKLTDYDAVVQTLRDTELEAKVGGRLTAYVTAQEIARSDLIRAELIATPLLFILLVWLFRSVVAALVPLVVGGVSIVTAMLVLRLLTLATDISVFTLNIVTFLGFGLAVDYSLFVVRRFREERARTQDAEVSLRKTSATAGRTIAFSGVAVAASLMGLFWFDIPLLRSIALGGTIITLVTLIIALVFLSALLGILGPWVDAGRIRHRAQTGVKESRFFFRTANLVMRRPLVVTLVVTAGLVAIASPVRRLEIQAGDAGLFPAKTEVRQVWDLTEGEGEQGFSPGELAPIDVVLEADAEFLARGAEEQRAALFEFGRGLEELSGVRRVDSLVTSPPRQPKARYEQLPALLERAPDAIEEQIGQAVSGRFAYLRVVHRYPASGEEAIALIDEIRERAPEGMEVHIGGRAAISRDVRLEMAEAGPPALATIAAVTFVVLFFAFGSFIIPIKAIAMNVLSVATAYGALVFVFQDGRLEGLLRFQSPGSLDPSILAVTFAIIFGLSMDYEVFLLSRVREEWERSGENAMSVAHGLAQTGRLITGAAAVLVAVVIGFIAGEMVFIKELGVGLAVAVLVDATIVRALLVPATMALMGHWNWWAPGPLQRWWLRSGIGVEE